MPDSEAFSFIVAGPTLTFQLGEEDSPSMHYLFIQIPSLSAMLTRFCFLLLTCRLARTGRAVHILFIKLPFFLSFTLEMPAKPRQSSIDIHLPPGRKKFSDCLTDLILCFCFPDPRRPLFGVVMTDQGGEGGAPLGSFFRDPLPPRRALS